jgi:hypothetical protein
MAKVLRMKSDVDGQKAPNKTSQAYLIGQLLYWVSGKLIPAVAASASLDGLSMDKITSDDDRYSTSGQIDYDRLKEADELEMDVTGAALNTAVPGTAYDLSDSQTVDLSKTTTKVLMYLRPGANGRGVFSVVRRTRATSA